jgi:hypothetical protein
LGKQSPNNYQQLKHFKKMKVKSLVWLLAMSVALFFACSKEDTDTTNITEDTIRVDTIRTDTIRTPCDSFAAIVLTQIDTSSNPPTALITVRPIGGVQPFRYRWSTGDSSNTIRVSSIGIYTVTVTDSRGCSRSFFGNVIFPNTCDNYRLQINTNGNTLTANTTGGRQPYTYQWSTGATTQSIIATTSGTYIVTVTDANGCVARQFTQTIVDCSAFKSTIYVSDSTTSTLVWVAATNGTAPYNYRWSNGVTTNFFTTTTSGTYRVTATDARNCTATDELNIARSPTCGTMTLRLTLNSVNNLTAVPLLGTAPYSYSWLATGGITANTSSIPTTSGNLYQVTVTDARGCTISGKLQR